jgi:hypothetical protein
MLGFGPSAQGRKPKGRQGQFNNFEKKPNHQLNWLFLAKK